MSDKGNFQLNRISCLIVCVLFICTTKTNAQSSGNDRTGADTLLHSIQLMPDDSNKVKTALMLSDWYYEKENDSALIFATIADGISSRIDYPAGRILSSGRIAWIYSGMGYQVKALKQMKDMYSLAEKKVPLLTVYVCNIMYFIYGFNGDNVETAYHWALRALNHPLFGKVSSRDQYHTFLQLGFYHLRTGRKDSANYFAEKIISLLHKQNTPLTTIEKGAYSFLGDLAIEQKRYSYALDQYNKTGEEIGLAKVYGALNRNDSALWFAKSALNKSMVQNKPVLKLMSSRLLAEIWQNKNRDSSNHYWGIYAEASDTLFNVNRRSQFEQMTLNEQQTIFSLQQQKQRDRNLLVQVSLSIVLLSAVILGMFLFRNNRFKQKHNEKLSASLIELKATQAQLIQSEKMASLGELTAGIAHEIQNPLNFVNNFSEVNKELADELEEEADKGNLSEVKLLARDIRANEEKIHLHGKRADAIVKSMLQHSRSSTGQKEPTDINALCDEYLRLAYHGMRAKDNNFNAALETTFDETIAPLNIIPQDIGRVLLNLYNNALYAVMEKKKAAENEFQPKVSVITQQKNGSVEILVKDNGPGIPEKMLDKIFQPFFTTKPTGQGTGLGLSISYDIVRGHGGEMRVENHTDGGALFIISLPE